MKNHLCLLTLLAVVNTLMDSAYPQVAQSVPYVPLESDKDIIRMENARFMLDQDGKTTDIDFGPWLSDFENKIKSHYYAPRLSQAARTAITLRVLSDGTICNVETLCSSEQILADLAALNSIAAVSGSREKLPGCYPGQYAKIAIVFDILTGTTPVQDGHPPIYYWTHQPSTGFNTARAMNSMQAIVPLKYKTLQPLFLSQSTLLCTDLWCNEEQPDGFLSYISISLKDDHRLSAIRKHKQRMAEHMRRLHEQKAMDARLRKSKP